MTWKSGITLALAGLCLAGTATAQVPGSSMQPGGPSNPSGRGTAAGHATHSIHRTDSGSDTTLRPRDSGSADYGCDDPNALRDCTGSRRTASLSEIETGLRAPFATRDAQLDGPLPARAPSAP